MNEAELQAAIAQTQAAVDKDKADLAAAQKAVRDKQASLAANQARLEALKRQLEALLKPPALPAGANLIANAQFDTPADWTASEGKLEVVGGRLTFFGPASVYGAPLRGVSGKLTLQMAVRADPAVGANLMLRLWRKSGGFVDFRSATAKSGRWEVLQVSAELPPDLDAAVPFVQGAGQAEWAFAAPSANPNPAPTPSPAPSGGTTKLAQLPDSVDVPGPLRGLHVADGKGDPNTVDPPLYGGGHIYDYSTEYTRYNWRTLNPSPGVYNLAPIIADRDAAKSRGRTVAFGVTVMDSDDWENNYGLPDYIGQNADVTGAGKKWCKWNSNPYYINPMKGLIAALGKQFDGDPWVEWVDARPWGNWGECHAYGSPFGEANETTKQALADAYLTAFPRTLLLIPNGDIWLTNYLVKPANKLVGQRRDSYSWGDFSGYNPAQYTPEVLEAWKRVPFVVENGGRIDNNQDWNKALEQVINYHLATLKDQNHGHRWNEWNPADRALWEQCILRSGYRLTALEMTRPMSVKVGDPVPVTLKWQNAPQNVTPLYRDFRAETFLLDSAGKEWAKTVSTLNLRSLFPGDSKTVTDRLSTAGVPAGSYQLRLRAVDMAGVRKPLQLALAGRLADGSYSLGGLSVL